MLEKTRRILFSLIVLLIPINLGKHFEGTFAFVRSNLIDYLIPTIWFIDVLIGLLLVLWLIDKGFKFIIKGKIFRLVVIFLGVFLPSVFIAERITPSLYFYLTFSTRLLFLYYITVEISPDKNFSKITKILSVSVLFLAILGILQWFKQGSLFNNYLFFGEQPYSPSSPFVNRVNFFGHTRIPVYGTFRHPNVFGGFLSIVLSWIYFEITRSKKLNTFLIATFFLGFVCLLFTFSQVALLGFVLPLLFLFLIRRLGKKGVVISIFITLLIFFISIYVFGIGIQEFDFLRKDPSFYRRANLLKSSYLMLKSAYIMLKENLLFGVGINNFTVALPKYLPLSQVLVFTQPVHNIFILVLVESGIFAFLLFCFLLVFSGYSLLKRGFGVPAILFVTVLQLIILGTFDHYLYTIHQTQIMLWLTIGLSLAYTELDEKA